MSCTVEHRRLYCVSFGPLFESDDEGEWFRVWVYRRHGDPRQFTDEQLARWLDEWRRGQVDAHAVDYWTLQARVREAIKGES
jgi:hypothetical protein